jgi:hypothetical protein
MLPILQDFYVCPAAQAVAGPIKLGWEGKKDYEKNRH